MEYTVEIQGSITRINSNEFMFWWSHSFAGSKTTPSKGPFTGPGVRITLFSFLDEWWLPRNTAMRIRQSQDACIFGYVPALATLFNIVSRCKPDVWTCQG